MAKPFDATLNSLIDLRPGDWAACFAALTGIPPGPSTVVDTDLATTLQADKVFRIDGASPSLLHLELEANPRRGIPRELMRYNTLIDHQHDLPVESVLVLLRPKAFASDQTGHYRRTEAHGNAIAEFRYRVERVWERSVDYWLEAGLGLSPLALLTDEADGNLEVALDRFRGNLKGTGIDERAAKSLLGSSFVLCGLRYQRDRVVEMYRRLSMLMEESTTYQYILEKGLTQGQKALLLRQGTKRFGPPSAANVAAFEAMSDAARLESLAERMLDAADWNGLLRDS